MIRNKAIGELKNTVSDFVLHIYVCCVLQDAKGLSLAGFVSWLIWRSAYLTRVLSWRNRFYVAVNWGTTFVFGRDNSRIGWISVAALKQKQSTFLTHYLGWVVSLCILLFLFFYIHCKTYISWYKKLDRINMISYNNLFFIYYGFIVKYCRTSFTLQIVKLIFCNRTIFFIKELSRTNIYRKNSIKIKKNKKCKHQVVSLYIFC